MKKSELKLLIKEIISQSLVNKRVRRKGSSTVWEVFGETDDTISLMNYSQSKNMSKIIPKRSFSKNWEIVK